VRVELPDGDHELLAARRHDPEVLEGELAECPAADDEHAGAGREPALGTAHGAEGRDAGVGERSGPGWVEGAQPDEVPGMGDEHRLRVAAVGLEAGSHRSLAELFGTATALAAVAAAPATVDDDRVAGREV